MGTNGQQAHIILGYSNMATPEISVQCYIVDNGDHSIRMSLIVNDVIGCIYRIFGTYDQQHLHDFRLYLRSRSSVKGSFPSAANIKTFTKRRIHLNE